MSCGQHIAFTVAVPQDLALGAHTLVVASSGLDPISVDVTVLPPGQLAVTGAMLPWGLALLASVLVVVGMLLSPMRRRRA